MTGAGANDVIIVGPGTYTENIYINSKNDLVIRASGNPENTKIVADNSSKYVVQIQNANRITIQGFNVSGGIHGIGLEGSTGSTLENNVVHSNQNYGIYLSNSNNATLRNNTMFNNSKDGISLYFSSGNIISDNVFSNDTILSGTHGIFLNNSHYNDMQSNTISDCDYGIAIRYSNNNDLISNIASENNRGIFLALTSRTNNLSENQVNSNLMNGIILNGAGSDNNIINNTARLNTENGIWLVNSSNNSVTNNNASQNAKGIYLQSSATSGNTLSGNIANLNSYGILLENAGSNNNLSGNTINSNTNYGIYLVNSSSNFLLNNVASSENKGIYIMTSSGNTISNNTLSDTTTDGIMLSLSDNNILSRNRASNNGFGIFLNSSDNNEISSNRVTSSVNFSIAMCAASNGNQVFNNYFNSSSNARVRNAFNDWNTTKIAGTSIAGGPYLGGNFWGKPDGSGHSQTKADNNSDGIIEEIFITDNITDYLPLKEIIVVLPEADFTTNVSRGYVPLTVQFTDLSKNTTGWSWNFGDGNSSAYQNTTHTYSTAGNYTVTLTASNVNGTATKTAVITVMNNAPGPDNILPVASFTASPTSGRYPLTVLFTDTSQNSTSRSWDVNGDGVEDSTEVSFAYTYNTKGEYPATLAARNANGTDTETLKIYVEGGGSSSGGGGGGGGSPEPAKNVEVKELSQAFINNGKAVQFDFTKNATCVVYVNFNAKKTVGKTTTIVEQLKNKSTLTSSLNEGEVYKHFNVWVGNSGFATSSNIEKPGICFKVAKPWLQDKNIDQNSITLNRYEDEDKYDGKDGTWTQLPVSLLKEDNEYLYFTADVPGYAFFAITGKSKASSDDNVVIKPDEPDDTDEEDTESETEPVSSEEKKPGIPGFGMVCGIVGLSAAFLYRRK